MIDVGFQNHIKLTGYCSVFFFHSGSVFLWDVEIICGGWLKEDKGWHILTIAKHVHSLNLWETYLKIEERKIFD